MNTSEIMDEQAVQLTELKSGDILIFDGEENDAISKLIMLFTKSKVSHSAIFMKEGNELALADAGPDGLNMHLVTNRPNAREVHIRRICKEGGFDGNFDRFIDPVIDIVHDYIMQGHPYPYLDLVLIAMIVVYKDVSHVSLKQTGVINLLKFASAELKKFKDEKLQGSKHSIISPSFVYQCYHDASRNNPDLKINVKSDLSNENGGKRTATLLDLYAEHAAEYNCTRSFSMETEEPVKATLQEILDDLVDWENRNHIHLLKNDALSDAIEGFLRNLMKICGVKISNIRKLIENAKKQQAMFVTPNDLYCRTTNTVSVGKINLERNREIYNAP